ncbi:hypothetical protein [Kitasatospora sp. NPDC056184]|uniref:hypothetical protein n=1 Tax=Kitasatospora sp. NPDC056184 TaxID=3345738 RepID=UPI0035D65612
MRRIGEVTTYRYWSERRIRVIARDNGLRLEAPWRLSTASSPTSVLGLGLPVFAFQRPEGYERSRRKTADRLAKALRGSIAVTYDEPGARFAGGLGRVAFSAFTVGPQRDKGVVLHARTRNGSGRRVDLCLFGSVDNAADFRTGEAVEGGTSSAWYAVSELLESRGTRSTCGWDEQELAFEALKIATGDRDRSESEAEEPWTLPWALGHADEAEWLAVVYSDVTLDPERWHLGGTDFEGTHRIIVGAPIWVRTATPQAVVRYSQLRAPASARPTWWRRLLPGRSPAGPPAALAAGTPHLDAEDVTDRSAAL